MNKPSQTAKVVLAAVAAVVLLVGAYVGYWALARNNNTQQYKVNTQGQAYQSGLVSQERDRVSGWLIATDPAQKSLLRTQFCTVYPDLNPPPVDLVQSAALLGC